MKTLRIILFLIFGTIYTLHSFAQELKKENKAKIKMEIIDDEGNKKVIDTTFTIAPGEDYEKLLNQIKEKAGFSVEKITKMKQELNVKHFEIEAGGMMKHFNNDSLHKYMMFARENMHSGKEDLIKALEDLKVELEVLKMNSEAMKKLEKAMEELKQTDWTKHAKHFDIKMDEFHKHLDKNMNVTILDSDKDKNHIWVDKDGQKIIVKTQKGGENTIFFGNESDLEKLHKEDGEHRIIVKKLPKEAAKGEAIFISDDIHVVKDFKDEHGNVKTFQYTMKSNDGNEKEIEVIVDTDRKMKKEFSNKFIMISPANDKDIEKAIQKGIFNGKAGNLNQAKFTFEVNVETTTIGANFEEKGKLIVQLFDAEMNKIWEKNEGKVRGNWSMVLPANLIDKKGKYFILFNQNNKLKLHKLIIK